MEIQKTKHQLKLEEWKSRVRECRSSGKSIKSWCDEHEISVQTYYRWQKLVWEAGTQPSALACNPGARITFAEYQPPALNADARSNIVVHLSCGKVEIPNGANRETIALTLEALRLLC